MHHDQLEHLIPKVVPSPTTPLIEGTHCLHFPECSFSMPRSSPLIPHMVIRPHALLLGLVLFPTTLPLLKVDWRCVGSLPNPSSLTLMLFSGLDKEIGLGEEVSTWGRVLSSVSDSSCLSHTSEAGRFGQAAAGSRMVHDKCLPASACALAFVARL